MAEPLAPQAEPGVVPGPKLQPLRLAVVTETYPPEVNGVAMTVARLVQGLRSRGHHLHLVRPRQHRHEQAGASGLDELLLRGLPIPRYPQLKMGLPATGTLLAHWQQQRPDLVHIATEGPLGWSALRAARRLRLPVTSDFRTNFHAYSQHYGIGWLQRPIVGYLRSFHNSTQATMVPTPVLQRELVRQGFHNVSVVARGVDTQQFSPDRRSAALRAAWGAGADTCVVAHVGRLAPEKNLGLLVQAFEAMRQVRPDSLLLLVGDGPARAELQARCPGAVFAGMRGGDDLAAHYASADAFVFPSMTETYGNVTPEAMASGLPVLAYDHAAAGQLIAHQHNGLLARLGSVDEFIAMAAQLAGSPQQALAWGQQARLTTLACGWDQVVCQVEGLMRAAWNRHASAVALSSDDSNITDHASNVLRRARTPPG
ncbi:MAG: glycosyltransferase family 1 protein [Aquabacterium sp.]|nr:glycosyltransferase family 1 protein [Aquabacterium sp.]